MSDIPYRQYLDQIADDFILHDVKGQILEVGAQACLSLGYSHAELLRLKVSDLSASHSSDALQQLWDCMEPGRATRWLDKLRRRDGTLIPVEMQISCQRVDGEKRFFTLSRDTSERIGREAEIRALNTQLERQVQESTRQWKDTARLLDAVLRDTPDIIYLKDLEGRYLFCNDAAIRFFARPKHQVLGCTDAEFFPEGVAECEASDRQVLTSNIAHTSDQPIMHQGEMRIFQTIKSPFRDENGELTGLLGISRDMTDVRLAREKLQQSHDSLQRAERLSHTGSWTLDLATRRFSASEMLYEMCGADPNGPALTPESLRSMLDPQDYQAAMQAITACAQHGSSYDLSVRHRRQGGGSFPARFRGQALRDQQGRIYALSGTVQDLSEHEQARERLEALADNLPSGAIYRIEERDGRLRLTYISAGIETLIGVAAHTILADDRAYLDTIVAEDRARHDALLLQSQASGNAFDCSFRILRPDGSQRWLRSRAALHGIDGAPVWDGVLLDITHEREAEQALQQAKAAAEKAESVKSDFLATMSHEIRTPMNTVIGMTRLLQQTPLLPRQRNYLDKVDLSAKALLAILNDILDFSKIEAGMLRLEEVDFDLDAILETVSAINTLRAEEKGVEIVYRIAPEVPRRLRGDPLRLGQILTNLVSNAVKFTEEGEISVSVRLGLDTERLMLEVQVSDTGIGMSPAQMQRLFRPFSQADAQTTRRYGGTGLGLAICQQLVTLMGGSISVESALGEGSRFRFTVALAPAQSSRPAPRRSYGAPLCERTLVVDDNASARHILTEMLGGFGMNAEAVSSGEVALQRLQQASHEGRPYQLVLLDWRMPGMDGLEVTRQIREHACLSATPAVLMVTSYAREEVLRRAEALGVQGLLIKPVTESVLFNTIQDIFRPPLAADTHERSTLAPTLRISDLASRLSAKRVLVVDDNALNREVAAEFLRLVDMQVTCAHHGRHALELLRSQTFDAVLMDVHMPDMDGLEATRAIRENPAWQQLPVIAVTAQAREQDRREISAAGMNAHLTKPIDQHQLYATLDQLLQPGTPGVAAPGDTPGIDWQAVHTRFAGSAERIQRLLLGFVRDFSGAPDALVQADQSGDCAALAALTHQLKGALGYLGAQELMQQAGQLEELADQRQHAALQRALPAFESALRQLLAQVAQTAARGAPAADSPSRSPAVGDSEISKGFPALRSLIAHGDYAAVEQLEQLSQRLQPGHRAQLASIQDHVDDLETDLALAELEALAQQLALPDQDSTS
jgi:PAS domain S-box-containing protein